VVKKEEQERMLNSSQNIIFREMARDLCYRLQLFNERFCKASSLVLSAVATEDFGTKVDAAASLKACAQALQLIFADFNLLFDSQHIVFPPEFHVWVWFMTDADDLTHDYLQRLQNIAQAMESRLFSALHSREETE
jgi:hypothetical protein